MSFPKQRPRRLRRSPGLRRLVRQTRLSVDDFIYPIFVSQVITEPVAIESMPGISNFPVEEAVREAERAFSLGIPAILLFGTPEQKDATGSASWSDNGIIQQAVRAIKKEIPELVVVTDVCLCEYTDHGHCGVVQGSNVDNDATLELLARQAVSHAAAGADMVAPSDMMDGRVGAIRKALDQAGFSSIPVMSYAAKFCSAFYGPFREAVDSAPRFGDRRTYQMDPPNAREATHEMRLDIEEGADIVMVKPALAYLDIISAARREFEYPVAAYNVSGEYAMVKLAAQAGQADEKRLTMEVLTSIKRAGADIIITYHACDVARWISENEE